MLVCVNCSPPYMFQIHCSPSQWLASICAVIDMLRMIVLHPDGAPVLLRHVEVNGT